MDLLSNLKYAEGSKKKRKRVGRGEGSGHGGYSTRGMNGQNSRSGAKFRAWFEGGQMPLQRRIPKVGFNSPFKVVYQVVNLAQLQKFVEKNPVEGTIDAKVLYKGGLISYALRPYKILGDGGLTAKINIVAHGFSKKAEEKIIAAGGTINKLS